MTQYVGNNPTDVLDGFIKRYFYGLHRNDDGELFLVRLDQLAPGTDPITLNELGEADGNFPDFEEKNLEKNRKFLKILKISKIVPNCSELSEMLCMIVSGLKMKLKSGFISKWCEALSLEFGHVAPFGENQGSPTNSLTLTL